VTDEASQLGGIGRKDLFSKEMEIEADCLAGARATTIYCEARFEPSDIEEAVFLLSNFGDKPRSPSYDPNARGADQQRIDAL
jgi:hypothetical protein